MTTSQTFSEVPGFSIRRMYGEEFSHFRDSWNGLLDAPASESSFLKWKPVYTFRGEEAYKYRFCEDSRRAYSVMRFGPGVRGRLAGTLFRVRGWLKGLGAGSRKIRVLDAGPGAQNLCVQGR